MDIKDKVIVIKNIVIIAILCAMLVFFVAACVTRGAAFGGYGMGHRGWC
jgi:hypothetical protein